MMLARAAQSIVLADGWRRILIAFAAGALSALAMAPFNIWFVLALTFPVLIWLVDGAAGGRYSGALPAAIAGWAFGFGYFVAGLYWIGYAFLVDAKTFGWLLPVAVAGLPAYLALFTGAALAIARLFWMRGPERILVFAMTMTASEWLRGHLLTGFPWNTYGYALTEPLALAQSASVVGVWGLTFVALVVFALPALFNDDRVDTPHPARPLVLAIAALCAMAGYGVWRLAQNPTHYVNNVKLRIMQPNLPQDDKFNYSAKAAVMERYVRLSDRATGPQSNGVRDITHLIWPESAFPFFVAREPDALAKITELIKPSTVLITGAIRAPSVPPNTRITSAYNSVYVFDREGIIQSIYDKVHLVPFGEYLPFQNLLERIGLMNLTKQRGGFLAGDRRRAMTVPDAPKMLPLVCYEVIFPGAVPDGERPGWLVNLTNDGWFGISTGPYQHFQQARVRAIEEGLPLVRAANTGISAVIDPVGRIVTSLPLGVEGVLDSRLPVALPPTSYSVTGNSGLLLMYLAAAALIFRRRFGRG